MTPAPTATDNCEGGITGTTPDPLTYEEAGSYTITWVFDDGNGNLVNQDQNVLIADTTSPEFMCPDDAITCDGTLEDIAPAGVTDNCSDVTVSYLLTGATSGSGAADASAEVFSQGITTVKYAFEDAAGNIDSCFFTVTYEVVDVTVTQNEATLTANGDDSYQWFDGNAGASLDGETG